MLRSESNSWPADSQRVLLKAADWRELSKKISFACASKFPLVPRTVFHLTTEAGNSQNVVFVMNIGDN
jgi:hypothetical protein